MSRQCGVADRTCEEWELWATGILNSLSNLFIVPAFIVICRQGLRFEAATAVFTTLTSCMYHFLEPIGIPAFGMNAGKWHRLDNIGAITCFSNLFIYLADFGNDATEEWLKYAFLFTTIILQEKAPWNVTFTIVPVLSALALPVLRPLLVRRWPGYHWRLNERHDYLRCTHALWHVAISASSFFLWKSVTRHHDKLHGL